MTSLVDRSKISNLKRIQSLDGRQFKRNRSLDRGFSTSPGRDLHNRHTNEGALPDSKGTRKQHAHETRDEFLDRLRVKTEQTSEVQHHPPLKTPQKAAKTARNDVKYSVVQHRKASPVKTLDPNNKQIHNRQISQQQPQMTSVTATGKAQERPMVGFDILSPRNKILERVHCMLNSTHEEKHFDKFKKRALFPRMKHEQQSTTAALISPREHIGGHVGIESKTKITLVQENPKKKMQKSNLKSSQAATELLRTTTLTSESAKGTSALSPRDRVKNLITSNLSLRCETPPPLPRQLDQRPTPTELLAKPQQPKRRSEKNGKSHNPQPESPASPAFNQELGEPDASGNVAPKSQMVTQTSIAQPQSDHRKPQWANANADSETPVQAQKSYATSSHGNPEPSKKLSKVSKDGKPLDQSFGELPRQQTGSNSQGESGRASQVLQSEMETVANGKPKLVESKTTPLPADPTAEESPGRYDSPRTRGAKQFLNLINSFYNEKITTDEEKKTIESAYKCADMFFKQQNSSPNSDGFISGRFSEPVIFEDLRGINAGVAYERKTFLLK
jgi:hypothetical protein